jgi:hypothetical protein
MDECYDYVRMRPGTFRFLSLWLMLPALVLPACTREPAGPAAPPGAARPENDLPQVVAGKAARHAIIVLEPTVPRDLPLPAEPQTMDQFGRAFFPELLLVLKGQQVAFSNNDNELHNVRVGEDASKEVIFNVATIPYKSYTYTFDRPGFYDVTCDVHQEMRATILVTSTPYATVAGADGRFTLTDVLPGAYDLTMYAGGRQVTRRVDVSRAQTDLVIETGAP